MSASDLRSVVGALVGFMDTVTHISHQSLHRDLLRMNSCVCDEDIDFVSLKDIVDETEASVDAIRQNIADASAALAKVAEIAPKKMRRFVQNSFVKLHFVR